MNQWTVLLCFLSCIASKRLIAQNDGIPSFESVGFPSLSDDQLAERGQLSAGNPSAQDIRSKANVPLSIADMLHWDFRDEAAELRISNEISEIVTKGILVRKRERNENLLTLKKKYEAAALATAPGDTKAQEAEARKAFTEADEKSETEFTELLSEVFPPNEYRLLMRLLLKRTGSRVGGAPALVDYLKLDAKQQLVFAEVYKQSVAFPSEPERWVKLMHRAEDSLNKEQFEEFNKAIGRIPADLTIEEYFNSLADADKAKLRRTFRVYRSLE